MTYLVDKTGLRQSDIEEVLHVLLDYDEVEEAILFGSRAKGNYRHGSDIDIALKGEIDFKIVSNLSYLLNQESMMPYKFDIVSYNKIEYEVLKEHIDRVGIVFYKKDMLISA